MREGRQCHLPYAVAVDRHVAGPTTRWQQRDQAVIPRPPFPINRERFFSDSEWVIATDFTFHQADRLIEELTGWLIGKQELPAQAESKKIPASENKSSAWLTGVARARATDELARPKVISANYNECLDVIH